MNAPRLEELLVAWEENSLTDEALAELKHLLATEPQARRRLVEAGVFQSVAESRVQAWKALEPVGQMPSVGMRRKPSGFDWLQWRPLAAAAAGIVLGMFCTSVVMAYMAAPSAGKGLTLFRDSFEEGARQWSHGFPNETGVWSGDAGEVVSGSGEVQPLEGLHMARLDPSPTATMSYLERIVDLQSLPVPQGDEVRQVAVTASFHAAERGLRDRYTLRAVAFEEAPGMVRKLWVDWRWRDVDCVLTASRRAINTAADAEGWQTLTVRVEVPREARSLVISLASGVFQNPDRKTAHYIDGVHATLSIIPQPTVTNTKRIKSHKPSAP